MNSHFLYRTYSVKNFVFSLLSTAVILSTLLGGCAKETPKQASSRDPKDAAIEAKLQSFDQNPNAFMNAVPEKWDSQGLPPSTKPAPFVRIPKDIDAWTIDEREIFLNDQKRYLAEREFVTDRDEQRARLRVPDPVGVNIPLPKELENRKLEGRAQIKSNDKARKLFDRPVKFLDTLVEMDTYRSSNLGEQNAPWSDDYWGLYKGSLAARYNDPRFKPSKHWEKNYEFFEDNTISFDNLPSNASSLDALSTAEKYDLIVGDGKQHFTHFNWDTAKPYLKNGKGDVETWMGICHGWAPAAYRVMRPTHAIKVRIPDSPLTVNFYPTDIRGLASALWANAENVGSNFVGDRCNQKKPPQDANGRVMDQSCFDNNPGAWHMAVVNKIAVEKQSFILDATYDYEVWNQPIYGYSYKYFNPKTKKTVAKLEDAKVRLSDFTNDKFKKYRNTDPTLPKSEWVVGVAMDLTYVVEVDPRKELKNDSSNDERQTVQYLYDVELTEDGKINGGEWYVNTHPDFLWTPKSDEFALSSPEVSFAQGRNSAPKDLWQQISKNGLPKSWQSVAVEASKGGTPLSFIVNALVMESRGLK